MKEPENGDIFELLTAFADGELDASRSLQTLSYLQKHPDAMRWMQDQQRITIATRSGFAKSPVKASDQLRRQISSLMKSTPVARDRNTRPTTRRLLASSSIVAVAASVLIAIGGVIGWQSQRTIDSRTPDFGTPDFRTPDSRTPQQIIPASLVSRASQVHADCSRLAEGLHSASFVERDAPLAAEVQQDLHSADPFPDLTSIGFRYEGAGPCVKPLDNTIHLLYRSMRPGVRQSVSLFVQQNTGQFKLEANRIYTASVAQSPFPMLVWRTDRVVYFLLADTNDTEQAALDLIQKPTTQPTTRPAS